MFLESADAHRWFFAAFGWLAAWLPFSTAAWTGRLLSWAFLAFAWRRLIGAVAPGPGVAVLSAGWMIALVQVGNMAGEWVVGGFEAKCIAFPLVLLAMRNMLLGQWSWVWPQLGLAVIFHVLVGGWALLAIGAVRLFQLTGGRSIRGAEWTGATLGAIATAVGVWPVLALSQGVSPEVRDQASWIYVYQRLGHHLVFHRFAHEAVAIHAAIWLTAIVAWRRLGRRSDVAQRLSLGPMAGAALFSGLLVLVGVALDQGLLHHPRTAAPWLRFYWFRLADVLAPWWLSCVAAQWWVIVINKSTRNWRRFAWGVVLAAALAAPAAGLAKRLIHPPSTVQYRNVIASEEESRELQWRATCRWIREHTDPRAHFLTPAHQRSFKWFAERPEVWTWKDIPQDAASIVDWWTTRGEVTWAMAEGQPARLLKALKHHRAGYYVWDRGAYPRPSESPELQIVFVSPAAKGEPWFTVFRVAGDRQTF